MLYTRFLLWILMAGSISSSAFANIILDDVMNQQTQVETGVDHLNAKQKQALETWLNTHFMPKTQPTATAPELFLSININAGHQIQLSDGSIWDIDPSDVEQASIWISPFPVHIVPSNNPEYPHLLVNTISGISVKARPAESSTEMKTPPQPQAPVTPKP